MLWRLLPEAEKKKKVRGKSGKTEASKRHRDVWARWEACTSHNFNINNENNKISPFLSPTSFRTRHLEIFSGKKIKSPWKLLTQAGVHQAGWLRSGEASYSFRYWGWRERRIFPSNQGGACKDPYFTNERERGGGIRGFVTARRPPEVSSPWQLSMWVRRYFGKGRHPTPPPLLYSFPFLLCEVATTQGILKYIIVRGWGLVVEPLA